MQVLVIEDDRKIAGFIAESLQQEGHVVTVVFDAEAGLCAMEKGGGAETFDAVVLDLLLPKLDGPSALVALRSRGINTPVLILSALDSVNDRVRGLRGGADDYLVKPFSFDELNARLLSLVRRAARPARQDVRRTATARPPSATTVARNWRNASGTL